MVIITGALSVCIKYNMHLMSITKVKDLEKQQYESGIKQHLTINNFNLNYL